MSKILYKISRDNLIKIIVATLLNKFDFFIAIEGNTGTGKSTLAIHIARGVRAEFHRLFLLKPLTVEYYYERIGKKQGYSIEQFCDLILELKKEKAYNYNPNEDLIYDRNSMIKCLNSRYRIFIPDEMVAISFNRDFQTDEQKKIIKLINMMRDRRNLILACIPSFSTMDVQVKNLTKMRISVMKRGLAIIQTPNKIIYGKDRWDSTNNEKIEREWLMKGMNPKYNKLTTARGMMFFPKLPASVEKIYQKIKDEKRTKIFEKEFAGKNEKKNIYDETIERLLAGKLRNIHWLDSLAVANNLEPNSFRAGIRSRLVKMGKNPLISDYFFDRKGREAGMIVIK